ncbi:MAG: ATP-binding protein [Microcystaceae cyanobacterium]
MNQSNQHQLLKQLYNSFNPLQPLKAGATTYINCDDVRGDEDIKIVLGKKILFSDQSQFTYQLYTGHRGAGKSTELERLKQHLEENNFYVIYFAADEEIEQDDTQHTDILLACTRHLLESLEDEANAAPLVEWLKERWESLKDLASTEINFEKADIQAGIFQFAKVTAVMRTSPSTREKIRQEVEKHTPSLIEELNKFIEEAREKLENKAGIVVIVDNLDRISLDIIDPNTKRTNHDQIFIDRSGQLRSINCHMIYTVPISMVYSEKATVLEERFGNTTPVLPMIMTYERDGKEYSEGIEKLKAILEKRIQAVNESKTLDDIFESQELVKKLCLMSGGHVRNLILLMRTTLERTSSLPIKEKEVKRAISTMRKTYRNAINENQWELLAKVHLSKNKINDYEYQKLLFNRSILEYHAIENDEMKPWYDVHPLILEIEEFQEAVAKCQQENEE